jgi:hypothetical protein
MKIPFTQLCFICLAGLLIATQVSAHHVLGRPSYSLNEDSNTPPAMQAELQMGSYTILYMAFPAFPKANQNGRINIHASHITSGDSYAGEMTFKVTDDSWFSSKTETLGVQQADDNVYRQGFIFSEDGNYIISVEFDEGEHHHVIDFPLRVGPPAAIGPAGIIVGTVLFLLLIVSLSNRHKLQRARTKRHHIENDGLEKSETS